MADSRSCSHWWHAPIYFVVTVTLAIVAITTSSHHHHHHHQSSTNPNSLPPPSPPHHDPPLTPISSKAVRALRSHGFNFMATLVHVSPELFLSRPESTIFAIHDSAMIADLALPPWFLINLVRYHTSPSKLTMADLMRRQTSSCIPTLLQGKNLEITKVDRVEDVVEINEVQISHPDIFTDRNYSIHGVLHQFISPISTVMDLQQPISVDFIQNPQFCNPRKPPKISPPKNPNPSTTQENPPRNGAIPWANIIESLNSAGFESFSMGLGSVLDGIVKDTENVSSVTIFAPRDLGFEVGESLSSSPLFGRVVRLHVLPERFSYRDLAALPKRASLRTLVGDSDVVVSEGVDTGDDLNEVVAINGVEVTDPDVMGAEEFVVHGIARCLVMEEMMNVSTSSR